MIRLYLFISLLLVASHSVTAQQTTTNNSLPKIDSEWIQKVLDSWDTICRKELKIKLTPLPWIIFYDSVAAWHLNPDTKLLPPFEKTTYRFRYNQQNFDLIRIPLSQKVWVPDREAIPIGTLPTVAMPYANNQKSFFIGPLPSLFHLAAPPSEAPYLDLLFVGTNMHELTHTRQLSFVLPTLLQVQKKYKLPEDIDDNTVENTFAKNASYKELFIAEKNLLWKAVSTENTDSCIAYIEQAFQVSDRRKKEFLSRDSIGYDKINEIFTSLEGSAMWSQYRIMLKNIPRPLSEKELLGWLVQRLPTWSQEEGLALFLLIDRLDPNWKAQFFEKELPSAFEYLRNLTANKKRK